MNQHETEYKRLIATVFSDGTGLFRQPAEPDPGDEVLLRLRLQKGADVNVSLLIDDDVPVCMRKCRSDDLFDWYEAGFRCSEKSFYYTFLIEFDGQFIRCDRRGACPVQRTTPPDHRAAFRIMPGFHVPAWSKGAVQYQILPDRFAKGNPDSDVRDREYAYARGIIRHAASWDALPGTDDYRCHYGGDLVGVREKLDYLQSLGVEAIYLNPVFVSPSPHKYDTQDYEHVDPHLTQIVTDGGRTLEAGESSNANADLYIRRTVCQENLTASNDWFASFCGELHRRGIKIILDGVFNHCGSFNRWMDRERIYPGNMGAYGNPESPYRSYFGFESDYDYHCWWGIDTLPKLCYEQSDALKEYIMQIAEKWAKPPYCIDGWRLDVAADLGHSASFNHLFWKEFRRRVKAVNPDVLIIAEHYGDPSDWLQGDEWDTVMNYDAFMEPLSFFLTGMEKHSDYRRDDLYQDGQAFFDTMSEAMLRLPTASVYAAMDELSNHDHSRFMTRTNGRTGRVHTAGNAAASEGIKPEVFREAAVVQMTWPGAPTIYYGDEAGLTGWTDPDNRRTYPWGKEDESLISMYRSLAALRREYPVLRHGSIKPLCAGTGYIAYARFDAESSAVIICNNTDAPLELELPLGGIGAADGTRFNERFCTASGQAVPKGISVGKVKDGVFRYTAPALSAVILTAAV